MALATVQGRQVDYQLEGSGELVVLLAASWWPLDTWKLSGFPELRGEYQVLAPNHRGIGASAPTDPPYSADNQAGDTVALLDALGLAGPAHVVSFAQGTGVALQLALRHPQRVRSLVLAAPSAGTPPTEPAPSLREREHIAHIAFRDFIRNHALNDDFAFAPANYAAHHERAVALADALWEHQGPEEEYVQRGRSTPAGTARELAAAMPNARLHLIPNVRHMTFWEDPPAAWAPVREFLKSL
jgi:pimeloyl-ACP methyl ester carboxylesterase